MQDPGGQQVGFLLGSLGITVALVSELTARALPKEEGKEHIVHFKGWPRLTWFVTEHLPRPPKDWTPPQRPQPDSPACIEVILPISPFPSAPLYMCESSAVLIFSKGWISSWCCRNTLSSSDSLSLPHYCLPLQGRYACVSTCVCVSMATYCRGGNGVHRGPQEVNLSLAWTVDSCLQWTACHLYPSCCYDNSSHLMAAFDS